MLPLRSLPFLALSLAFAASACATPVVRTPALAAPPGALVEEIHGSSGAAVGLLTLAEGPRGVLIRINLLAGALPAGWHGLHFHEHGDCGGAFAAAGAHAGHGGTAEHGLLSPRGPEPGDLPNLLIPPGSPAVAVELYSSMVTLEGARGRANLRDDDGAALIIHELPDDHSSQPIGGAGGRIACAVIPPG